jgi:hypothetical protein
MSPVWVWKQQLPIPASILTLPTRTNARVPGYLLHTTITTVIARTRLAWYRSCRWHISNQVQHEGEETWAADLLLHQSAPLAKNFQHVAAHRPWYAVQVCLPPISPCLPYLACIIGETRRRAPSQSFRCMLYNCFAVKSSWTHTLTEPPLPSPRAPKQPDSGSKPPISTVHQPIRHVPVVWHQRLVAW